MRDDAESRDLAWWYPRLRDSRVLTPETIIVDGPGEAAMIRRTAPRVAVSYIEFLKRLARAVKTIGLPCLLRTGTVRPIAFGVREGLLEHIEQLDVHVRKIRSMPVHAELPSKWWVVQQFVPLTGYINFHDGGVAGREFVVAARDGTPLCVHPVWTAERVEERQPVEPDWRYLTSKIVDPGQNELRVLLNLSVIATAALPGTWLLHWGMSSDGRWVALDAEPSAGCGCAGCSHAHGDPSARVVDPGTYIVDPESGKDLPALWQIEVSLSKPEGSAVGD